MSIGDVWPREIGDVGFEVAAKRGVRGSLKSPGTAVLDGLSASEKLEAGEG